MFKMHISGVVSSGGKIVSSSTDNNTRHKPSDGSMVGNIVHSAAMQINLMQKDGKLFPYMAKTKIKKPFYRFL